MEEFLGAGRGADEDRGEGLGPRTATPRVGGAPKSYHLSGDAVDFRVSGNISGAARYLAGLGGGYKHYGGGLFHIDNGPRRSF